MPESTQPVSPPAPTPVMKHDEAIDFDISPAEWVLAMLTIPLLFWVLMYAVTGAEHIIATRRARMRLYAILLALEAVIVAIIVAVVVL